MVKPRILAAFQMMSVRYHVRLPTAGVAYDGISSAREQTAKRLAGQFSTDTVDNDVYALSAGQSHHAISQTLFR